VRIEPGMKARGLLMVRVVKQQLKPVGLHNSGRVGDRETGKGLSE